MELSHLKQILFIDSSLYTCTREKDGEYNIDILVDLPPNPDLIGRKNQFK